MQTKPKSALLAGFLSLLIALAALPATANASKGTSETGYVPADKEVYVVSDSKDEPRRLTGSAGQALPSRYRSDEQPWAAGIAKKDQENAAICWAFAMTSAAEYSYAKEVYEASGKIYAVSEASPAHLAQFFYERVDDPLRNTSGDFNALPDGEHWALSGGNELLGMQHLATWSGFALEEKAPLEATTQHILKDASGQSYWDGSASPYPANLAYDDAYILENSIFLKHVDIDSVKGAVATYGACTAAIDFESKYFNRDEINPETGKKFASGRSFYNYASSPSFNHVVTIIGWDDNYPKENFAHSVTGKSAEASRSLTTPNEDGAWIVQNSWGAEQHDGGVFYVSYESVDFDQANNEVYAFDMQSVDAYAYNFQYDGTAFSYDSTDADSDGTAFPYRTTAGTRAANVYTNTTGGTVSIDAVGFTTYNMGTTGYDISIYVGLANSSDPTSGKLAGTTRMTTTTPGCKTAKLNASVIVRAGETFSVVVSFLQDNAFGVERDFIDDYWIFDAETQAKQSFFSASAGRAWVDMNDYAACFRIKAFANVAAEPAHAPGWANEGGSWYYYNDDGSLRTSEWLWYGGKYYYFGKDGRAVTNDWVSYGGKWYYLNANGNPVVNGWVSYAGKWYYLNANGNPVVNGWVSYGGKWYYLNANGNPVVNGWVSYAGKWYYLNANGNPVVNGWVSYGGTWYHFNGSGTCDRTWKG